jgi:RND family efflux transporter MFP subunit
LLLAAVVAGGCRVAASPAEAEPEPEPLPVATVAFRLEDAHAETRRFTGEVRSGQASRLGFERGGRVARVVVKEGARVAAGDVLARLDTAQLRAARRRVQAGLEQARARRELSNLTAQRVGRLAREEFAPVQDADEARLGRDAAEARVDELEARLAQIAVDLRKSVLRAPFAGLVSDRLVDEGTVVGPGAPVLRLVHDGGKEAFVGVPVEMLRTLAVGSKHTVVVGEAAPRVVSARVTGLVDDVDPGTRTAGVILKLSGDVEVAEGEVVRRRAARGGWLPLSALEAGLRGLWTVYRVGADGVAVREAVEILHTDGDRAFVEGTLSDGDHVIARGLHRLVPGQRVREAE